MPQPTGLLMTTASVDPALVRQVLTEQGGPEWDETVFQMLTGVDLLGLAQGAPAAGDGTALAFASSGWWLRSIDELADRLAKETKAPVLAAFEAPDAKTSGFHLARPDGGAERRVEARKGAWGRGVSSLLGEEPSGVAALEDVARVVHGDEASGATLPGMFNFALGRATADERRLLGEVYGTALVGGYEWKPGARRDPAEALPDRMRVIALSGPPRLPGPPRWAKADQADAIKIAQAVMDDDGWVCLAPKIGETLCIYGAAVQLSQFAPLPQDGRWAGVLHPREAVRIGHFDDDGLARITAVEQTGVADPKAFQTALDRVIQLLPEKAPEVDWDEAALRASDDPARLLAWQLPVDAEPSQSYLGSSDPTTRLEVLIAALMGK